ncbi:MAG: FAD binding domain-containing protein [Anaerolineaceae bacterium]|nr:FAD binding domain-containing protein [Anaerolineaceae bacterium]
MWKQHINASNQNQIIELLSNLKESARLIAGGTDLILEIERGIRPGVDCLIDISRVQGLDDIYIGDDALLHIGPMVTHNQIIVNHLARKYAMPLVEACWQVGSPQIRNRATVAGNLITASPANDTITPLMALQTKIGLRSTAGTRYIELKDFYTGVRKSVIEPDEMLVDIAIKPLTEIQKGAFYKYGLRNSQAISVVNACVIITREGENILDATITMGAVAPTIIHASASEEYLKDKQLKDETIKKAAELAAQESRPIDDIRASAGFRKYLVELCVSKSLIAIRDQSAEKPVPENPVLLDNGTKAERLNADTEDIQTIINGKSYQFMNSRGKTLLQLIREDAGLTGSKEGCAEGECGACTVFLDGKAVMSCLVPAGRAHHASIITIEGLAKGSQLNAVQLGFIEKGAVQCGYCTPGMIMSATKLLEEKEKPGKDDIVQALAGNLCRCTGYYQIIEAVESAIKR